MSAELRQRLTAILAADVVGYSKLMAADERATVAALDEVRSVFRREIEQNAGRVVDMAGDSILALFETASGALSAALRAQETIEKAFSSSPAERRMQVRIGLHLGEVMVKRDRSIYGNGVNIAARLQAIARPGGICISQTVYDTLKGKVSIGVESARTQPLKNIAEPVAAWHVTGSGAPASKPVSTRGRWLASTLVVVLALAVFGAWWWSKHQPPASQALPDAKSIAVLPFTNMTDQNKNAYFADGVHEELLTQLALLGDLKVVSRTSVAEYRETKKNVRQIGAELGVGSLVEGSVRREGNRVRVSVQLIDARADRHLWANTYDRELKDIFAIQSELATEIARALKISLSPGEERRLARKPTENLQAYELLLRHQELFARSMNSSADTDLSRRIELLSRAVELDPGFAIAWARLAAEHARFHFYAIDHAEARLKRAQEALDRALSLAADDAEVRTEAGYVYYYGYRDFPRAAQYMEESLRIAPNHVETLNQLGFVRRRQGRWSDGNALHHRAVAVDPRNLQALSTLHENYLFFRHFDESLAFQRRVVELQPGNLDALARLHWTEYLKTGSFATYDAWRATLPVGAEKNWLWVTWTDIRRASARRDFHRVVQLVDGSATGRWRDFFSLYEVKVFALLAKGERSKATELARSNLRQAAADLRKRPDDSELLQRVLLLRAVLGERDSVLAQYYRWIREQPIVRKDIFAAMDAAELEPRLYAVIGDRDHAFKTLRELLRRPSQVPVNFWRLSAFFFAAFRDDPQFQAMVSDPANNAPLEIVNMEPASVVATLRRSD